MKQILLLILSSFIVLSLPAQGFQPVPEDKAIVYLFKTAGMTLANYTFVDSSTMVARMKGVDYARYECLPGKRILWVTSGFDWDFVEAELEPGKIYFLGSAIKDGNPQMIKLEAIDPSNWEHRDEWLDYIKQNAPKSKKLLQSKFIKKTVARGIQYYWDQKADGQDFTQLDKGTSVEDLD